MKSQHMKLWATLPALAIIASSWGLEARAAAPSFNCANVQRPDEIALCQNDDLARLDNVLNFGFHYLKKNVSKPTALKLARVFIKERQACGSDVPCIREASVRAINSYKGAGAPIQVPVWQKGTNASVEAVDVGSAEAQFSRDMASSLVDTTDMDVTQIVNSGLFTKADIDRVDPLMKNYTACVVSYLRENANIASDSDVKSKLEFAFRTCQPNRYDIHLFLLVKNFNDSLTEEASKIAAEPANSVSSGIATEQAEVSGTGQHSTMATSDDANIDRRACHGMMGTTSRWDGKPHDMAECSADPDRYITALSAGNRKAIEERKAEGLSIDDLPDNRPVLSRMVVTRNFVENFRSSDNTGSIDILMSAMLMVNDWSKDTQRYSQAVVTDEQQAEIRRLRQSFEGMLRTNLPSLRRAYADLLGKKLWENDINVTVTGANADTIEFQGYLFALNANVKAINDELAPALRQFRFRQVRYITHKEAETYKSQELPNVDDGAVAIWQGVSYEKVF